MIFRSIRWRIALPYLALMSVLLVGMGLWFNARVKQVYLERLEAQLAGEAQLLAEALHGYFQRPDADMDNLARTYSASLNARVTFINRSGDVLGESHEDRATMDNHLYRPEIQRALSSGQVGTSIRYSRTVDYDMMYVAVPVREGDATLGFVRLSLPLTTIDRQIAGFNRMLGTTTVLVLGIAFAMALLISARTVVPIRQLTRMAQRLSEGDLEARLVPITKDELRTLTLTFNEMAERLQTQIATLHREQALLSALFSSIADGVLVVDEVGLVQMGNLAAARILNENVVELPGQTFAELVRHHRLITLWHEALAAGHEVLDTVELTPGNVVQVIITPLDEHLPQRLYLVLMQDLTRLRHLETVRRDFVANVSHELRTPLASLKALVQTLQEGALQDPEAAPRFVAQMEDQVDTLVQMVEELLELTRLESGRAPLRFAATSVAEIIGPAVERLRPQADRAQLSLIVDVPDDLPPVWADAERARQMMINLIHNAIKFTPAGGWVRVSAQRQGAMVAISVADNGVGISADDLPRIFERFYKSDRARSSGGTGLGLAIVRHIVQAHGGQVSVQSREGEGSVFTVTLPIAE